MFLYCPGEQVSNAWVTKIPSHSMVHTLWALFEQRTLAQSGNQKILNSVETRPGPRRLAYCIFIAGTGFPPRVRLRATPMLMSRCVSAR